MDMQPVYTRIKRKTDEGDVAGALLLVNEALATNGEEAYLLYLKGKIHLKTGDWREATHCFLHSKALDENGPAGEAIELVRNIMEFYNKDLYNP